MAAASHKMETFKQWRESEWGQEFKACIKPVQHAEPEEQYEQPSLYEKFFGGGTRVSPAVLC